MKRFWLKSVGLALLTLFVVLWGLDWRFPLALPDEQGDNTFATLVVDLHQQPLRAFADHQGVWRHQVSLEQVSPLYLEALLGYEDQYFWSHPGINPLSLFRALKQNLGSGKVVSGGSTLSMQVARLLHPHPKTVWGKLQQIGRTLQLEWHLSKAEILSLYLNHAPFGGTIEGVQAASYSYLDKSAAQLTHAEAALLAVLPQAPTRYRPDLHPKRAEAARNKVLDRMVELGIWSQMVVDDAKIEAVEAYRAKRPMLAPLLAQRLKNSHSGAQRLIKTTIDGQLQRALEQHLAHFIEPMPKGASAAVLVMDNHTGAVRAYLGSADIHNAERFGHVDMVQAIRSPGSTLKPFLFAMALEHGLIHSHSLLADVPITWGAYRPSNFSQGFSGPVSASEALQRSLNVPFIDLLERLGPKRFVSRLNGAGLTLKTPNDQANLAVILGGTGAKLEQLVGAFAAFSRAGKALQPKYLTQELATGVGERYLTDKASAWVTYKVLEAIEPPGSLNRYVNQASGQAIAWKTGTSFGFRDSWAIGTRGQYTVGVWVGRPDNTPMPGYHGRKTAGPLLFSVFGYLNDSNPAPMKPAQVSQQQICWPLGTLVQQHLAPSLCRQRHQAWIVNDTIPMTYHGTGKDSWLSNPMVYWTNPDTGLRVNASCEGNHKQRAYLALWPKVLEPWLPRHWRKNAMLPEMDPACPGALTSSGESLMIKGLVDGTVYRANKDHRHWPRIKLQALGSSGSTDWYINGQYRYSLKADASIKHQLTTLGEHQIVVVDQAGHIDKVQLEVKYF